MTQIQIDREMVLDILHKMRALIETDTDEGKELRDHAMELIQLVSTAQTSSRKAAFPRISARGR